MIADWELSLALHALGVTDPAKQQQVKNAIPIADKLVGHINDNKHLFDTLWADIQLIIPAVKIVLDALNNKGATP